MSQDQEWNFTVVTVAVSTIKKLQQEEKPEEKIDLDNSQTK